MSFQNWHFVGVKSPGRRINTGSNCFSPDSVTSIGEQAFYDCTGLTSITIPNSVKSIGNYAFSGCTGLESIIVKSGNAAYHSAGNCLIKTGNKTVIAGCKNSIIPNDGSVTEIGNSAFSGCVGLSSITIPDSVTWVRDCAFSGCTGLTSVTIGNGVTEIGSDAFSECTGLTSITIPDSVTSIGWFAFDRCTGLTSITIPDSVTSIDDYAFSDCTGLTDVYYTGTEKQKSEIIIGVENNYLLNATWHYAADSNITYSITYNLGGGTNNKTNPKSYIAGKANISLKNPTKSGYTFKGWYSDKGLTKKVTQISKTSASNITLYAKWEKAYTVTYKLNSGTNSSGNPKTFTATTATITLKNPTRKGYTFKGWYSNSKFTGSKVTKIAKGTKKNITLYAKWSKNTYKITYKLNSGKNNSKNPKTYTVTSAFTLKKPTRKGYTFKGWYSDSKFKKKVTKIAKGSTGNKTLYAKWTKK